LQVSDFDAFRQFGTYLFEQRFDILDDLRGIRTGGLEDHRADARVAVGIALVGIGFAAQFDVGDIFQTQHLTVGERADDDLAELFGRFVTSAVFHRILERVLRVFAQRTRGRLDVLFGQCGRHVRRDELVLRHHVGFQPDAHRIVGAEREGFADARNTQDTRFDVDFRIVGEERLVVGVVGTVQREDLYHGGLALHG